MDSNTDKDIEELQKGLDLLWKAATRGCIVIGGTVNGVDAVNYTCGVNTLFGSYVNVPLAVLKGAQGGDVQLPVDGSDCLITFKANDSNRPQMFAVSNIDKWYITANKVIFNNSTTGIPVTNDLVTRLNDLENKVNDILNILKTTIIPLAPSGTYPFAPLYSGVNDLVPTVASDIESTKVFNDN